MKPKKVYALRSTAQCNPDGEGACVRSMNDHCKVGQILGDKYWQWTDINKAHGQAAGYNSKTCGCRAQVVELEPPF